VGGKTTSTSSPKLNQMSVQSSSLGLPITLGWGRGRAKCNLGDYVAFKATAHTTTTSAGKGLGGGSKDTTYTYTASIIMHICEGPILGIRTVYRDTSVFTDGATTALAQAGLSVALGSPTQSPWSYMVSQFPTHALAYSGIAYVYAQDYALGDSATLSNHSFEIDFEIQLGGGVPDADPKDILTDFLTSASHGVPGWGAGLIGDLSDWSLYCRANNLLLSPVLESQAAANTIITEWCLATNSAPFWSEGVLKVRPYGDTAATGNGVTWTPNLTPIYDLTEDDFEASDTGPVVLDIVDQSDAYNIVQLEFLDRANQYNVGIATASDLANIFEYGARKQDPTTVHSIVDAGIAQHAAQLYLQRVLYVREQYLFTLPWNFVLLEPCDYLSLTTTTDELQLDNLLVRVVEIDEDENGMLAFTCEGVPGGAASAALYASHSSGGHQTNADVPPGPVSTPVLINAPTSLTGGDPEVWCAVASSSTTWGGCEVWISVDNVSYARVGVIEGPARYGVLTAALANHADPDTTNTLSVDLSSSLGTLGSATATEANAGGSLCLVGNELITYQTATLTGANAYNLTTLRRGFEATIPASHSVGAEFVRLDDAIFKFSYASLNVGSTIYVKFPSFNIFDRAPEDLSTVTAYTVALAPATALPDSVTGLALAHSWDGSALSVVCDPSARAISYKFRFYLPDETTLKREIVTTTPAATYTSTLAAQDGAARAYHIEVIASNDAGDAAPSSWLSVTNAAPATLSGVATSGTTATDGAVTCTASSDPDLAGYVVFYSGTSGFDPSTSGGVVSSGIPSVSIFGLAAGTYYARIAAYDGWTGVPSLLNLSSEVSFTISTGGGAAPSGGGTGGGGWGGACCTLETLIQMANDGRTGPGSWKRGGDVVPGDWVWTQHERTLAWGAYQVTFAQTLERPIWSLSGYPDATAEHPFWITGTGWVLMGDIGTPAGTAAIRHLTVDRAHTYVARHPDADVGILSHNKRSTPDG
jgi:hypothetical protein